MTFARWLSAQKERDGWIGDLARAAAKDGRFPWSGEPLDMERRLRAAGGAQRLHALQAALDEWHGGPYSLAKDQWERDEAAKAKKRAASEAAERAEEEAKRLRRNQLAAERRRQAKTA